MKAENGQDAMRAFAERWLSKFPKPKVVLMDAAKTFSSEAFPEFMSNLNILVCIVAEKESWADGVIEAVVQDVKFTASAIHWRPWNRIPWSVPLFLATSALNSTEYTAGFSSYQRTLGKKHSLSDEDIRTLHGRDAPCPSWRTRPSINL